MNCAELTKHVVLQYSTRVPDNMGGATISWVDVATVFAAIWPTSAKELIQNSQNTGVISHRIRIRWRDNIRVSWRIKYGKRIFNIVSPPINPNMANEWLDILCKEVV